MKVKTDLISCHKYLSTNFLTTLLYLYFVSCQELITSYDHITHGTYCIVYMGNNLEGLYCWLIDWCLTSSENKMYITMTIQVKIFRIETCIKKIANCILVDNNLHMKDFVDYCSQI